MWLVNGTGNVYIRAKTGEDSILAVPDGAVELYYDNEKVFETYQHGVLVQNTNGNGEITIRGSEGNGAQLYLQCDDADDNEDRWRIDTNASNGSFGIQNFGDGAWEKNIECNHGGGVELYYDNTKKLEVVSGGAEITGDFWIKDGTPGLYFVDTNDSDVTAKITNTSGNLKLESDTGNTTGSSSIRFSVDGTEEVRILAGGGVTFNGDTAADNALNDYEQGTWTAGSDQGTCNNPETCRYQKIGHIVWVWGAVDDFSDRTGTTDVRITGLPFTVSENSYGTGIFYRVAYTDDAGQVGALVNTSEEIKFLVSSQGGSESWFYIDYNDLNASDSQMKFAIWYRTTQ
jgi:hypothetical protein